MPILLLILAMANADDAEDRLAGEAAARVSGEALYALHCRTCHGAAGDGKGLAGRTITPPPRDFTQAAFWDGRTDEALVTAIRDGKPGTAMVPFAGRLTDVEMADIASYLRAFSPERFDSTQVAP